MVNTNQPADRKERRTGTQNSPTTAAESLVGAALQQYGPGMLRRGGAAQRASKAAANGTPPAKAAAIAAKQGKGTIAETRLAIDMSVRSGLHGKGFTCRPNPCSNDPHVDLQLCFSTGSVAGTVQVGTGRPSYVQRKQASRADQVVVSTDSLRHLRAKDQGAAPTLHDRVQFDGVSSAPFSGKQVEHESASILAGMLNHLKPVSFGTQVKFSLRAGSQCSLMGGISTLVLRAFERLARGEALDKSLIDEAFREAIDAFVHGSLQSFLVVRIFVYKATPAFDGQLLRWLGKCSVWAGAFADLLIHLVKDFLSWCREEIDLEELTRRACVKLVEVLSAGAAALLALALGAGLPSLLLAVLIFAAVWVGGVVGRELGELLFPSAPERSGGGVGCR
jgi:hypothetical protein